MSLKKFDQINVIPFIDIMLVLLAIVLLTASFSKNGKIDVNLPAAENAEAVETEMLPKVITVDIDSYLYLDDERLNIEDLDTKMAEWLKEQPILLKIDKDAPFNSFVAISDLIKKYDFAIVSILTESSAGRINPESNEESEATP